MIRNYKGAQYESLGIDLNNFDTSTMIKRFANIEVTGINVLLLIYKQKIQRVTAMGIHLPDIAIEDDKEYSSMVGLVLKIGADAYKGASFPSGAYCKVGD